MFCLGKNNLITSQVIKKNNEKGKSLKNSQCACLEMTFRQSTKSYDVPEELSPGVVATT